MRRVIIIISIIIQSQLVLGQYTKVKHVDTIQVTGEVIFIDTLKNFDLVQTTWDRNPPYCLILFKPNMLSIKNLDCYLVIRVIMHDMFSLKLNQTTSFKIIRTEYIKPDFIFQDNSGVEPSMKFSMDTLVKQINKNYFFSEFLESAPCSEFFLKEKIYYRYEKIPSASGSLFRH